MSNWLVILSLMGFVLLASDALPVSQRDLVDRYGDYNGKRIKVSGEVVSSEEMTVMNLPGTNGATAKECLALSLSMQARSPTPSLGDLRRT